MAAEQPAGPVQRYPLKHQRLLLLVSLLLPQFHATASEDCPQGDAPGCISHPDFQSLAPGPVRALNFVQVSSSMKKKPLEDYGLNAGNDAFVHESSAVSSGSATEAQATTSSKKATAGGERQEVKPVERLKTNPASMPSTAHATASAAAKALGDELATAISRNASDGTDRHTDRASEYAQAAIASAAAASFAGAASLKSAVEILGESMVQTDPVNGTFFSQQSRLFAEAERATRMIRRHLAAVTLRVQSLSSYALVAVVLMVGTLVLFMMAYMGFWLTGFSGDAAAAQRLHTGLLPRRSSAMQSWAAVGRTSIASPLPRRAGNVTGKGTAVKLGPVSALVAQRASTPKESSVGDTPKAAGAESDDKAERDSYFCSELVVPPGSECILKVHARPLSFGPFDVTDINDNAVLHVEPRSVNIPAAGMGPASSISLGAPDTVPCQRLVLTTEYGTVMAQCGPSLGRGKRECVLLRAGGDHYARINKAEDQGAFVMSTLSGLRLVFCGSFNSEDKVMSVVDGSGRLVAKTGSVSSLMASEKVAGSTDLEPLPPHVYRLWVAPLVDVGLVLCGLLCIQHFL